ncbi:MAG TPA: CDP-alcohol phosphatidyltransferase family protein [Stackebrandtia sp.]|uniref:CDP-alcohol phosphatidyltransferase family protein n=1 Tax=Stackebrandtia sp. TaxID=2023065 RepID=UPI002D4CBAF6|nr:CDP-alcohol phosphatidyltransferase family protein [Stackebrandtia sp.]HZE39782.1 CDP-alcohol phosphatidyltransferase family protein [Stackebrandtia sp.]
MSSAAPGTLRYADFLSHKRGGYLMTYHVSQRVGAAFALAAHRAGAAPTALTLINLVISLGTAALTIAVTPAAHAGHLPWWPIAIVVLIAWQVAYALDCADGQLARAAGLGSAAGGRVDILCDVAAQTGFIASVAAVTVAYAPGTPSWVVAAFASLWMVNLVTSILQKEEETASSMVSSKNIVVEIVKLIRDAAVIFLVMPLILIVNPGWMVWYMAFFAAVNALFLAASIAFTARDALRA